MASREPFSRHRRRDGGGPEPDALAHAADFAAHEYGWRPEYIEHELTDEQLVWYFDAAQDRLERTAVTEFERLVEAVRLGTIFAHDNRQHSRWRSRNAAKPNRGRSLSGAELEAAVMRVANMFPGNVLHQAAA